MKSYDLYIIGPVTIDYDEYMGETKTLLAGPGLFSTYAALASGSRIGLLAQTAPEQSYIHQMFYVQDIHHLEAPVTTTRVIYPTESRNERYLTMSGEIKVITPADIPDVQAKVYQLISYINGQLDFGLFPYLAARGKVACDMQGYVRYVGKDEHIYTADWPDKVKWFPYITYLKVDSDEAKTLTGFDDRRKAAKQLHEWGAREVLLTHSTEVMVYDGKEYHVCPFRPKDVSKGRSGRGDTTIGAYITERQRAGIDQALLYTAALVSLKQETFGPFKGTREDVLACIRERYPEFEEPKA